MDSEGCGGAFEEVAEGGEGWKRGFGAVVDEWGEETDEGGGRAARRRKEQLKSVMVNAKGEGRVSCRTRETSE